MYIALEMLAPPGQRFSHAESKRLAGLEINKAPPHDGQRQPPPRPADTNHRQHRDQHRARATHALHTRGDSSIQRLICCVHRRMTVVQLEVDTDAPDDVKHSTATATPQSRPPKAHDDSPRRPCLAPVATATVLCCNPRRSSCRARPGAPRTRRRLTLASTLLSGSCSPALLPFCLPALLPSFPCNPHHHG